MKFRSLLEVIVGAFHLFLTTFRFLLHGDKTCWHSDRIKAMDSGLNACGMLNGITLPILAKVECNVIGNVYDTSTHDESIRWEKSNEKNASVMN